MHLAHVTVKANNSDGQKHFSKYLKSLSHSIMLIRYSNFV